MKSFRKVTAYLRIFLQGCYLVVLAAALVCSPAWGQKARTSWEEARRVQLEAAHREGIPISLEDLQKQSVPPDQNADTFVAKIVEKDKAAPLSQQDTMAVDNLTRPSPTPDQIAQGRKVLVAHRERLLLIHQAARCPFYVAPPATLELNGMTLLDDFPRGAQFRDYARWLNAEGMLLLLDGKPFDAIQVVSLSFGLSRHAAAGSAIAYFVGEAINSIALGGLRLILYRVGSDASVAEAVSKTLETQYRAPSLAAALRGEVASALVLSDSQRRDIPRMLRGDPNSGEKPFEKTPEYRTWTRKFGYPTDPRQAASRSLDMNDAHYLAWIRRIIALADLPYPEALSGITAITREAEKNADHPDYFLAILRIGSSNKLPTTRARHQAIAEVVRVGASLLAWKAKNGRFPETLAECLPSPPPDPFDLRPIRYRREGGGFVVYSVGESGKFDGGKPDSKPKSGEILFRYPLPVYAQK